MIVDTISDENTTCYSDTVMYISLGTVAPPGTAIADDDIIQRYLCDDATIAIYFGGLEPLEQFDEIFNFVSKFRTEYHRRDDIVIYTTLDKNEVLSKIQALQMFDNIIIQFGRDRERIS